MLKLLCCVLLLQLFQSCESRVLHTPYVADTAAVPLHARLVTAAGFRNATCYTEPLHVAFHAQRAGLRQRACRVAGPGSGSAWATDITGQHAAMPLCASVHAASVGESVLAWRHSHWHNGRLNSASLSRRHPNEAAQLVGRYNLTRPGHHRFTVHVTSQQAARASEATHLWSLDVHAPDPPWRWWAQGLAVGANGQAGEGRTHHLVRDFPVAAVMVHPLASSRVVDDTRRHVQQLVSASAEGEAWRVAGVYRVVSSDSIIFAGRHVWRDLRDGDPPERDKQQQQQHVVGCPAACSHTLVGSLRHGRWLEACRDCTVHALVLVAQGRTAEPSTVRHWFTQLSRYAPVAVAQLLASLTCKGLLQCDCMGE